MSEIFDVFEDAEGITLYKDDNKTEYSSVDRDFELILDGFNGLLKGARQMPAFGVSLDGDTRKAMQNGVWVEFSFSRQLICYEMKFEKLLVNIVPEYRGFNIIRYNSEGGYDGRCFYISLAYDMSNFYNLLLSL